MVADTGHTQAREADQPTVEGIVEEEIESTETEEAEAAPTQLANSLTPAEEADGPGQDHQEIEKSQREGTTEAGAATTTATETTRKERAPSGAASQEEETTAVAPLRGQDTQATEIEPDQTATEEPTGRSPTTRRTQRPKMKAPRKTKSQLRRTKSQHSRTARRPAATTLSKLLAPIWPSNSTEQIVLSDLQERVQPNPPDANIFQYSIF